MASRRPSSREYTRLSYGDQLDNNETKVRIWQKDASSNQHICKETLRSKVSAGPKDNNISISISGMLPVKPDKDGNFLTSQPGSDEFDAVHTFSVIRMTLALYESDYLFNDPFQWNVQGNHTPITAYPHVPGEEINAYYCREKKYLVFFSAPSRIHPRTTVYTCRSFDCVAHETGHAILDHLKPLWHSNELPPQTGALHESFGDLTAIFLELSQMDQVESVIRQTNGDLKKKNFIEEFSENLGIEFGRPSGLRNASNTLKISQVGSEVHDLSQVFTGAIYDILANIFDYEKNRTNRNRYSQILFDLSRDLRIHLLQAIKVAPNASASFSDVAEQLVANARPEHLSIIQDQFRRREILGSSVSIPIDSSGEIQSRIGCCQTMQRMSKMESKTRQAEMVEREKQAENESQRRRQAENESHRKRQAEKERQEEGKNICIACLGSIFLLLIIGLACWFFIFRTVKKY